MSTLIQLFTKKTKEQEDSKALKTLLDEIGNLKQREKFLSDFIKEHKDTLSGSKSNLLPGVFTVSKDGKRVRFTRGNLCALVNEEGTKSLVWMLHKNQYDYVGNTSGNVQFKGGLVDLFNWTPRGLYKDGLKQYGINNSVKFSDYRYQGEHIACDWGGLINKKYDVLTAKEWGFLIKKCSSVGYIEKTKCLFLKPNKFKGEVKDQYTKKEWEKAEKSGLVALPLAGQRFIDKFYDVGEIGHYWTKDNRDANKNVKSAYLGDYNLVSRCGYRFMGNSVRLVARA